MWDVWRMYCNESATPCSAGTRKADYSQLLLCTAVASRDKDSVCCMWTSDTVIEQGRKWVVHLGRDTEFEWRQGGTRSDRITTDMCEKLILRLLVKRCLFITDFFVCRFNKYCKCWPKGLICYSMFDCVQLVESAHFPTGWFLCIPTLGLVKTWATHVPAIWHICWFHTKKAGGISRISS